MNSMKCEPSLPPQDVVTHHQQRHGVSSEPVRATTTRESTRNASDDVTILNPEDNWTITWHDIPENMQVPCLYDGTEKVALISVKVANTKICSVFPNIDQASKDFEELRKPLTTRSIRFQSVIEMYNKMLSVDCGAEYGSDFVLTPSDKFVLFDDFMQYYNNVKKAFPIIWQEKETSVPKEDINIVSGGIIELGNLPCPYIGRGNTVLLPAKIARLAGKGLDPGNDFLIMEAIPCLNGWPASPREIAYLTHICCINSIPLVFGRDTRLLPLSQMSCIFAEKMLIGNTIGDGQTFKRPTNMNAGRQNGGNMFSQNHQNGSVGAVPGTSNGQQVVNVQGTTAVPSTISYPMETADNRTVLLQNITGLRWIAARPMLVNLPQTSTAVPQNSGYVSTSNGEKRRRLDVDNMSAIRSSQSVGCS